MKQEYLDQKLIVYSESDFYPFHMPGHKRRSPDRWDPEAMDITEIDGFDNLHHAEGILARGQERLAGLAGADEAFYLVNGSTAGILSAVCGCARRGERILIARNCHKAVYHAAYLMGLKLEYLYPEPTGFGIQGSICPEQVRACMDRMPDLCAVVITSPTYDGVISDITSIASVVHERRIPLIVDEAHGAHFGYNGMFPPKAIRLGADLCVESLHKTLPSFTQTAVLLANHTGRYDISRVKRYLGICQTSSPSYLFMAGMDRCVRWIQENALPFDEFSARLDSFYTECSRLQYLDVFGRGSRDPGIYDRDCSKILISAAGAGMDGHTLAKVLREQYHLEMEMASGNYVTAITTVMDTAEGFSRLLKALQELDQSAQIREYGKTHRQGAVFTPVELYRPREKCMEIENAMNASAKRTPVSACGGCISAEFLYLYPPGIPLVVPGERISAEIPELITRCKKQGFEIQGPEDIHCEEIFTI